MRCLPARLSFVAFVVLTGACSSADGWLTGNAAVGGANTAPLSWPTATCNGNSCVFDGRGSRDDAGVVSYTWWIGNPSSPVNTGAVFSMTLAGPRTRTWKLTVRDGAGLVHTDSVTFSVPGNGSTATPAGPPPPPPPPPGPSNAPPVARPQASCSAYTCSFDGRGSTDDAAVVSWTWWIANPANPVNTNPVFTMTLSGPRTRTWKLTVRDAAGLSHTDSVTFTVPSGGGSGSFSASFTPTSLTIPTSEGAPYGDEEFWGTLTYAHWGHGYPPTKVVRLYICLSGQISAGSCSSAPPPTGPLSQSMLNEMRTRIGSFAGTGLRVLIRFIYNFGPPGPGARDVPASLIVTHIDQLAPILLQHRDLVFALQAGFIGSWGEWHSSTSGNDNTAARKLVLDRLAQHFRGVFPILVRNPSHLMIWSGSSVPSPDFGIHNDYYASDPVDATYYPRDGFTEQQQRAYTEQAAATAMFAGEFGALDQQRQACATLDAYSYLYRPQSIALYIYPPSVANYLQSQGCLLVFLNKVGTRIEARRVDVTGTPAPGAALRFALTLVNAGYGRVIRARPVTVLLHAGGQVIQQTPLTLSQLDLRTLAPGAQPVPRTFSFDVTLPQSLPSGTLTVSLLVPDPAPSLRPLAAYALPFNSVNGGGQQIFDPATGRNKLVTITSGVVAAQ